MSEMDPKAKWIPTEYRFRMIVTVHSSQPGLYGWANRTPRMFDNLEEALVQAKLPQGRGIISVRVDEAMNPETWQSNGRWEQRFKRKGGTGKHPA